MPARATVAEYRVHRGDEGFVRIAFVPQLMIEVPQNQLHREELVQSGTARRCPARRKWQ